MASLADREKPGIFSHPDTEQDPRVSGNPGRRVLLECNDNGMSMQPNCMFWHVCWLADAVQSSKADWPCQKPGSNAYQRRIRIAIDAFTPQALGLRTEVFKAIAATWGFGMDPAQKRLSSAGMADILGLGSARSKALGWCRIMMEG